MIEKVPLKRVASIRVSNIDKKSVAGEMPVRLCNYTDVYYRDRIRPDQDFMTATASAEQIAAFRIQLGDVIITKDSETAEDIAVPAYVEASAPDLVCGYHLAILRPRVPDMEGRFLYWVMASTLVREELAVSATGVTRYGLRTDNISGCAVPLPAVQQQRAIAGFLDAETTRIDALIRKKGELHRLLEGRWNAMLREVALNPGWPLVPLRRLWLVTDCKHRTPNYVDDGFPVVSPGDITAGRLNLAACHRFVDQDDLADLTEGGRFPRTGDVIYSRNASIGIAAYVDSDEPFTMGQDVCLIRSQTQNQLWLTYMLNSVGVDQLSELKIGSTFDRVNIAQLLNLAIPAPPPETQAAEVAKLDHVRQQIDQLQSSLQRQVELLQERRQTLISDAVLGKLDLSVAVA